MKYKFCHNCSALNRVDPHGKEGMATCGKCGIPLGDLKVVDELEENQLDKLIRNSEHLVVVDVFAQWCGPCKTYGPIFSKVGESNFEKAEFVKVDADKAINFSNRFNIRGVPATLYFKGGKIVGQQAGLMSETQLSQQIQQFL